MSKIAWLLQHEARLILNIRICVWMARLLALQWRLANKRIVVRAELLDVTLLHVPRCLRLPVRWWLCFSAELTASFVGRGLLEYVSFRCKANFRLFKSAARRFLDLVQRIIQLDEAPRLLVSLELRRKDSFACKSTVPVRFGLWLWIAFLELDWLRRIVLCAVCLLT